MHNLLRKFFDNFDNFFKKYFFFDFFASRKKIARFSTYVEGRLFRSDFLVKGLG